MAEPVYLTAIEAAEYLRLSELTLRNWRKTGYGPRFAKFGRRVAYGKADLVAWAEARVRDNTSAGKK